jgi:AraC-like DNA-binding protein
MTVGRNPIATVCALQFSALLGACAQLGLDADRLLARAGLARDRLADPQARIPAEYDRALWDAAVAESGDPALSLRVAERFALGTFGSFEYLLHNCSTVAELVERANEFMRLLDDLAQLELRIEGQLAALRLYRIGGFPMAPEGVECVFALLVAKSRSFGPGHGEMREVRFAHPRSTLLERYEAYFGCPVRFGAPCNELIGDASVMLLPLPGDPNLRSVLEDHARHQLERVPRGDPLLHDVRQRLLAQLRDGAPDTARLARAMHMSERTLRRRLQQAGTRYQDLLDGLRAQLAREYVLQAGVDVAQVSARLGFAEPSAFYRVFKRWTGMTPAQYQKRARDS